MLNWFTEELDKESQEWAKEALILETIIPIEIEMNKT